MICKKETVFLFGKEITGDLVKDRQEVTINWRAGQLVLDEPSFNGGKDIGPIRSQLYYRDWSGVR